MVRKRTVNPTFIRRYEILRRIYLKPSSVNELIAESNMNKLQVLSSLSNLLHNRAIKKVPIPEEPPKAIDEFFAKGLKRANKRTKHQYVILPAGRRKLAYLEWRYSLYQKITLPWSDEFNQSYYDEMTHLITKVLKLPIA